MPFEAFGVVGPGIYFLLESPSYLIYKKNRKMFYTYILQSLKDGSCYTGHTDDLATRLKKHNSGGVIYTAKKKPWKLAWYCAFQAKEKAIKFEKYLKAGSGFAFARKHLL